MTGGRTEHGGCNSPTGPRDATGADGSLAELTVFGNRTAQEVSGLLPQDAIARWAGDGRSLWVSGPTTARRRDIARLDLVTGRRVRLLEFGPSDPAGVRTTFGPPVVSADGRAYAYSYRYLLSDLFVGDRVQ